MRERKGRNWGRLTKRLGLRTTNGSGRREEGGGGFSPGRGPTPGPETGIMFPPSVMT